MVELKDIDKALAEYLLEIILKKQGNPTYKEAAEALSLRLGRPINPHYNLSVTYRHNAFLLICKNALPLGRAFGST